ncbi:lipoyl protein ligase domain-containing protein [Nesterenkonia xinjiangensis]|uniref:Lipoate-protein ligase A n=1 Tax=Nesterenkonia xinjiangensis TaxID=225327 RepID=A0A7Z0KA68_9MICC|nr:lipoate-protein ligase A [Nesterenkonia xinjiangensis]
MKRTRRRPRPVPELNLRRQTESLGVSADLEEAISLLQGTRDGSAVPLLRLYRPLPTVAFGQRDRRLPGFEAAAQACRRLGYEPLVRRAGGRAAAYHPGCLVVDHIEPDPDPIVESRDRFAAFGELLTDVLVSCGLDARLGEIPGEYCAGRESVHAVGGGETGAWSSDRRVKIIGTAQRVIATGWLFSSVIVVQGGPSVRRVLSEVYGHLNIPWDPLTAGAADELRPGLDVDAVEQAVLETYRRHWRLVPERHEAVTSG